MPNPYSSPRVDSRSNSTQASLTRASLARVIEAFLESRITAFEFDDQLEPFRASDDPLIHHVVGAVWFHYDDCIDHYVCLSKQEWNYFQRLLLALKSNCRLEPRPQQCWSVTQAIAVVSLLIFISYASQTDWQHLWMLCVPLGAVSLAISEWRYRTKKSAIPYDREIVPFASLSELATAYRSSKFQKSQSPKQIGNPPLRSPFVLGLSYISAYGFWVLLSPIAIFFQMLPDANTQIRVVAVTE